MDHVSTSLLWKIEHDVARNSVVADMRDGEVADISFVTLAIP